MKISGTNLRMALVDRRSELIRCSSITKDNTFDEQIATLDDIIEQIWMAKNVELTVVN
jgi:predicted NBD/HSP70 family sugar kinase